MTAELSGRLGRARFLRLGWFKRAVATTPPSIHGSNAVIHLTLPADTDFNPVLRSAKLARSLAVKETSSITTAAKTYTPLMGEATFTIAGFFQTTHDGYLDSIAQQVAGFTYAPIGTSSGCVRYSADAAVTEYEVTNTTSETVNFKATMQVSGEISREEL